MKGSFFIILLFTLVVAAFGEDQGNSVTQDFRPWVRDALQRGEKRVVIPPGTYRLAPEDGQKVVWNLRGLKGVEIVAEGVTLVSTKLTRALSLYECQDVTVRGLTIDYEPLPFTQGAVTQVAEDQSWVDVKLHEGYPLRAYSRIDVVDPATRYRKKGMPFLWGTKASLQDPDIVRVSLKGIGKAAVLGDLVSLNTGPERDGIPHALSLERCTSVTLHKVTVHSAPGMGILESDGGGKTSYLGCRVVPGPAPAGATEARLLSTSWDAIQSKTVRVGPHLEGCEIREAGDDSWSVQSADFLVLKKEGSVLTLASRDEYTIGVDQGDRLALNLGGPEATILSRTGLSRAEAQLGEEVLAKLSSAPGWSEWKVSPRCILVKLDRELPVKPGDSVYSPDRMGNGFTFVGNHVHSSGRILIKAAGLVEGNVLDTPHALVVCPELPASAAVGIDGLIIRRNRILRAGWFCPAPWSSQAGALSITANGAASSLRPAGVFQNVTIEDNVFEDCSGLNIGISSARDVVIRHNTFVRPFHDPPSTNGANYKIPNDRTIWVGESEGVLLEGNSTREAGPYGHE